MKRYDEIINAGIDYVNAFGVKDESLKVSLGMSFIEGAKWADDNPQDGLVDLNKVWHTATEEPQGDEWHIIYINEVGEIHTLKHKSVTFYGFPTLRSYAKGAGMLCWAYLDDLLPKGGEQ